ncbi:MAG: hypothetical protein IT385_15330 [Deltaproteobacteria bacterium]|nr:hypothetical protein [Deltaproteobacteria bacterium]
MNAAIVLGLLTLLVVFAALMLRRLPRRAALPSQRDAFLRALHARGFGPGVRGGEHDLTGRIDGVGITVVHGFGPRCELQLHLRAAAGVGFGEAPDRVSLDHVELDRLGLRGSEREVLTLVLDEEARAILGSLAASGATMTRDPSRPRLLVQLDADDRIEAPLDDVVALAHRLRKTGFSWDALLDRADACSDPELAARARLLVIASRPESEPRVGRAWAALVGPEDRDAALATLLRASSPILVGRALEALGRFGSVAALPALRALPASADRDAAIAAIVARAGHPDHGRLTLASDESGGLALTSEPPTLEPAVPSAGDSAHERLSERS